MQVSLTRYTTPHLLAYLERIPSGRERSVVLKLAERALEAGLVPLGPFHIRYDSGILASKGAGTQASSSCAARGHSAKAPSPKSGSRPATAGKRTESMLRPDRLRVSMRRPRLDL